MKNVDLENYLKYLKFNKNYSDNTILSYEKDILEYLEYLNREGLSLYDVKYSDIRFLLNYYDHELKKNSLSKNDLYISSFFKLSFCPEKS